MKKKLIRVSTVPLSLSGLLQGQLRYMSQHFDVLGVASNGDDNELSLVAQLENIPTYGIEMTRRITPLKDIKAVWQLFRLFKKEKPFIVHSHTPKAGTLSMLASKLAGVPHRLHTIAGLPLVEATGFKLTVLNIVEKVTYACATKIYPNSFGLADIILENKFTYKEKLKVIANGSSNGIDTSFFDPALYVDDCVALKFRADLEILDTDFVFIYAGRLVGDKGINELIGAFDKLCKQYDGLKLLLLGTYESELDPLKPETLNIIDHNKNIISTGWVNDVRPYYAIANALTFPSYREGFPNVVMQAAAMQLPCIVTNINGCNEIVKHNESGIIIPIKDELALYNAMDYVLTHKDDLKSMGLAARTNMVSNFERKKVWEALLFEYKSLYAN